MAEARKQGVPAVAVVIVNKDAGRLLDRALAALEHQTLAPRRVIVVDNASRDGSVDGLEERFSVVELHQLEENLGFAAGNNYGVGLAEDCEWIALLNPDAFPEPTWLERLLAAAEEHPDFSFFGSRLVNVSAVNRLDGTGDVYHVSGLAWRRDHGRRVDDGEPGSGEIFSPCAAAALYRRDVFLEVGGFDESFFCYYEDSDLSFRLRLKGYRCLYVPDSVVEHVGSATTGRESDFTIYHAFRNEIWTWAKNMPAPLLWRALPQHVLVNVLAAAVYIARGRASAILSAQRDALRDLPRILAERRRVQAGRAVAPAELRQLMAGGISAYTTAAGRAFYLWAARRLGSPP